MVSGDLEAFHAPLVTLRDGPDRIRNFLYLLCILILILILMDPSRSYRLGKAVPEDQFNEPPVSSPILIHLLRSRRREEGTWRCLGEEHCGGQRVVGEGVGYVHVRDGAGQGVSGN